MLKKILRLIGVALIVLIVILLVNTFRSKPWPVVASNTNPQPLPDSAIAHMSRAIQIPTIGINDTAAIDTAAFKMFGTFIDSAYPLVRSHLTKTMVDGLNFVFEWKGSDTVRPCLILMAHYDVVPVEAAVLDKWKAPPFSGAIIDSSIWGRGAIDDKCSLVAILEAAEAMLRKGFVPQRTIYLCFGHDEETNGTGAKAIVAYLQQKKVHAETVLDEGGEISKTIKDVSRPVAVVGVAEKGYASFELAVQKQGGHSSMPAKETAIDILITALHKLRSETPPSRITPPMKEFLHRVGSSSNSFLTRMAADNMWLLTGVVQNTISSTPEGSAMLHTTVVPTIVTAGLKDNVIPSTAKAIVNTRILTGETVASVQAYIAGIIQDSRISIKSVSRFGGDPSAATSVESAAFRRIESAITKNVPDVIPTPYLMIGASDSRAYRAISDGVLNFVPTVDGEGFHGINEHLPIADLQRSINFMMTVIEESNKEFK